MGGLYNILTDTEPPRARPGPSRPSSSSGGPPAAARCGGVTNPTTEHRDAVGRSEAQVGECIAHPGLSPGPINRRLRRRARELVFTRSKCVPERVKIQASLTAHWHDKGSHGKSRTPRETTGTIGHKKKVSHHRRRGAHTERQLRWK